jgi:hypothetical protein
MNIEIDKEFLETCGTASLQGLLLGKGVTGPQPITLRFKQTSYAWRQKNNGPELYLVPEFAPYCLVESVLRLVEQGYKVNIDWFS